MPATNSSISTCSSQQDEGHWGTGRLGGGPRRRAMDGRMQRKQAIHGLRAASWSENGTLALQSIGSTGQLDGLHARSLRLSTQPEAERLKRQLTSRLSPCMGEDTPICPRRLQAVPKDTAMAPTRCPSQTRSDGHTGRGELSRTLAPCSDGVFRVDAPSCRHLTRIGGIADWQTTGLGGGRCHGASGADSVQQPLHDRSQILLDDDGEWCRGRIESLLRIGTWHAQTAIYRSATCGLQLQYMERR
jgi:hypothetical protein